MHKNVPCVVILPDLYGKLQTDYPVVYLLHGYSGNYLDWITRVPALEKYVDEFHLIIVCPDGGFSSWYFDSPIDSTIRYETFMTKELVPDIDARYHTVTDRAHRGICGLSMGGHGALYLAIRHPGEFGAVASISGGVDIRPFPNNWDIKKRLGDIKTHRTNWEKNTVINLVDSLKNGELKIAIDDGVNDIFIKENRALHQKLLRLHIDHDYTERPGAHNWAYCRNAIAYELLFFRKYFYQSAYAAK
jgi:S-formylglutathione hydrolase FrmB